VPHSVLQMQWIQQPRYDAQRLPQSLSLESAAPSAFNRQHCYLLDYQHISTGTHQQYHLVLTMNFEHLISIHPPAARTQRHSHHNCAGHTPSMHPSERRLSQYRQPACQGHPFPKFQSRFLDGASPRLWQIPKIILDR